MKERIIDRRENPNFKERKVNRRKKEFVFPLTVYLSDTNAYGNVYFAKYIEWQGKAREDWFKTLFRDKADAFMQKYKMVTAEVSHKYKHECLPFDKVELGIIVEPTKMCLHFHFEFRFVDTKQIIGEGYQKIAFRKFNTNEIVPVPEEAIPAMERLHIL